MIRFETVRPILHLLPPEVSHQLTLLALRTIGVREWRTVDDPFEWHGLCFRNRVGIAAGFDKNAVALPGIEALGTGFVEVGTILVEPWKGNTLRPRVKRISGIEAIWNRLGFPSEGLDRIRKNLCAFPRSARKGLVVACNIGPHPAHVQKAKSAADYLATARDELLHLAAALFEYADLFVINLSSPNTPGLRNLLQSQDLARELFHPLIRTVRQLDIDSKRAHRTPLLVKLPPEDVNRVTWTEESLRTVVESLVATNACDGFVAVNTSSRLAIELGEDSGGISGGPLRTTALQLIRNLRHVVGSGPLVIGSGGITDPEHAAEFIEAGSDLVEMYSGLVYRGPGLLADCADLLRKQKHLPAGAF
jgi:dihydroorotate dehydrogenase